MKRHTYTLFDSFALSLTFLSSMNKGPATCVNGGSSETLSLGRSGGGCDLKDARGRVLPEKLGGGVRHASETVTLFQTRSVIFPTLFQT